jgi:hypothetical protein
MTFVRVAIAVEAAVSDPRLSPDGTSLSPNSSIMVLAIRLFRPEGIDASAETLRGRFFCQGHGRRSWIPPLEGIAP